MGEALGLIEFALAQFGMVKRNGHNNVPFGSGESGDGATQEQFGKKGFETKGTLIFVTMNNFQNIFTGDNGGACEREAQVEVAAIGAFEDRRDLPLIGEAAALAKGRIDKSDLSPTPGANETFVRSCARIAAQLADFGINKAERSIQAILDRPSQCGHKSRGMLPEYPGNGRGFVTETCHDASYSHDVSWMRPGGKEGQRLEFRWRIPQVRDK